MTALFTYAWSLLGWGYGSGERVKSTDAVHLFEPKSGYQMLKRIMILYEQMDYHWASPIVNTLYVNLICLFNDIWNNTQTEQCTENIWADLHLNSGHPDKDSIYAQMNLFTWSGWFELYTWIVLITYVFDFFGNIADGILGYIVWKLDDPDWTKPFCRPNELFILGMDCAMIMEGSLGHTKY